MASYGSGEGSPPGSEELKDQSRLALPTGQQGGAPDPPLSTQPDESVKDVDAPSVIIGLCVR